MATLYLTTKAAANWAIMVETPMRPLAMNYLAASGFFDKIVLVDREAGLEVKLEGADLLKATDLVGVLTASPAPQVSKPPKDPNHHCNTVNCDHSNHW